VSDWRVLFIQSQKKNSQTVKWGLLGGYTMGLFLPNLSKNLHLRQHVPRAAAQEVLVSWGGVSRIGT
jgi:hypothetical protein